MSNEERKVPELRFKGFFDDWEQRELKDISKKITEKNRGNELSETFTNSAEYGIVSQRDFFDKDISNSKNLNGYYIVREDDFVYNPRISNFAKVGPIKRNKLERTGVMSPLYYVFRTHDISNDYLEHYFNTTYWHRFMKMNGDSGARADRFAIKDSLFKTMPIPNPIFAEQVKIGKFLDILTNYLALHQRKINILQQIKQSYLSSMFPEKENNIPSLRFLNFKEPWENTKLEEYTTFRRGSFPQPYGLKKWYGGSEAMPFVQVIDVTERLTLVNNTKQTISKIAQQKSIYVPKGKVVVTLQGSIGRVAITQYDSYVDRTLLVFEEFKEETDNHFWAYTIQKKFDIEKRKAPGGTIKTITKEALSSFVVSIPSPGEQTKVGHFFQKLDETISLHQSKLEDLEQIKSSFLKKLFI